MSNQDDKTQHLDKELEIKVARYDALVAEKKLGDAEFKRRKYFVAYHFFTGFG